MKRSGWTGSWIISIFFFLGCDSSQPPIHLNPDMDIQPKYKAQARSNFFANGSTMQHPVPGTVARGDLDIDPLIKTGKDKNGDLLIDNPLAREPDILDRGEDRYRIYCRPCHGQQADGLSPVSIRAEITDSVNLRKERVRQLPAGRIFDVITNGSGLMPRYGNVVPAHDRWAIVAHLMTLLGEED